MLENELQKIKDEMIKNIEVRDNKLINDEIKHMNDNKNVKENISNDFNKTNYNNNNIDWKNREYKRGSIHYADLSGNQGSEQGNGLEGSRPVIIIQNDIGNKFSPTVIVAVLTSKMTKAKLPIHLELDSNTYGLPKDSVILFEQIRTLDKRRLGNKISQLNSEIMEKVDNAIDISMKNLPAKTYLEKLPKDMRQYIINVLKEIKRKEIQMKEMKKDGFDNSVIKKVHDKKMNILTQFIKYCKIHELDYEKFYILNKGINEEVKSELIAL